MTDLSELTLGRIRFSHDVLAKFEEGLGPLGQADRELVLYTAARDPDAVVALYLRLSRPRDPDGMAAPE